MNERLLVVGRRSYVGGYFAAYAQARQAGTMALSSQDCNFLDREQVRSFFESVGQEPLTIVFCAVIKKSPTNSFASLRDNLAMVNNLIYGAALVNVKSLIYFSSVDVYGNRPPVPLTEESRINPDTWYGLAKYCCEQMLLFANQVPYPVTVLRIPSIYGEYPGDKSVIGRMVASIRSGKPVCVSGAGSVRRDYVYIHDLCRILEALIPLRCHEIVNIATGQSRSILEIAQVVGAVLRQQVHIERQAVDTARDFDLVFDIGKLNGLIPGFQFTSLEDGVRTYLGEQPVHG
ncbi:MAG: NAD(P)-dependent oxidoreductase [Verrucomicrobiia bacterium]|jgi:UDP-glucose 4-epimerase